MSMMDMSSLLVVAMAAMMILMLLSFVHGHSAVGFPVQSQAM